MAQKFTEKWPSIVEGSLEELFAGRQGFLSMKCPGALKDLLGFAGLAGVEHLPAPRRGIHGVKHLRMVAGLSVKLSVAEGRPPKKPPPIEDLWCLWVAGCLHDLGREDDGKDPGHAERGAGIANRYLHHFHVDAPLASQIVRIIRNHGEDDETGFASIDLVFKDADALERHRLSPWDLDKERLRTRTARAWSDRVHALYWDGNPKRS